MNAMMAEVSKRSASATGPFLGAIFQQLFQKTLAFARAPEALDSLALLALCGSDYMRPDNELLRRIESSEVADYAFSQGGHEQNLIRPIPGLQAFADRFSLSRCGKRTRSAKFSRRPAGALGGQNPKSEARNPKQIPSSKPQTKRALGRCPRMSQNVPFFRIFVDILLYLS
jgi:hypothetical protein